MVLNTGIMQERLVLCSRTFTSIFKILIIRVISWDLHEEMNRAHYLEELFTAEIRLTQSHLQSAANTCNRFKTHFHRYAFPDLLAWSRPSMFTPCFLSCFFSLGTLLHQRQHARVIFLSALLIKALTRDLGPVTGHLSTLKSFTVHLQGSIKFHLLLELEWSATETSQCGGNAT